MQRVTGGPNSHTLSFSPYRPVSRGNSMRWPILISILSACSSSSMHEHRVDPQAQNASAERAMLSRDVAGSPGASGDSGCGAAVCGDGLVTGCETCDPQSSTPCAIADTCITVGCRRAQFSGEPNACTSLCKRWETKALVNDDGCCPVGGTRNKDNDCPCRANKDCAIGTYCDEGSCRPD
jgi:hypothetical protein